MTKASNKTTHNSNKNVKKKKKTATSRSKKQDNEPRNSIQAAFELCADDPEVSTRTGACIEPVNAIQAAIELCANDHVETSITTLTGGGDPKKRPIMSTTLGEELASTQSSWQSSWEQPITSSPDYPSDEEPKNANGATAEDHDPASQTAIQSNDVLKEKGAPSTLEPKNSTADPPSSTPGSTLPLVPASFKRN